mgnify:FL=1
MILNTIAPYLAQINNSSVRSKSSCNAYKIKIVQLFCVSFHVFYITCVQIYQHQIDGSTRAAAMFRYSLIITLFLTDGSVRFCSVDEVPS